MDQEAAEVNPNLQPRQFYHGTNVEFEPGAELEPPDKTGEKPTFVHSQYDPAHVYVTTSQSQAEGFAASAHARRGGGGKHVYEVEPHEDVHLDPEVEHMGPGWQVNFRTSRARVLRRVS